MKKPKVTREPEVLPPQSNDNTRIAESGLGKIGDVLNKLEPQQLISLANSVTNFATVSFEYAAACQKTKEVEINAHVRIRDIEAGREKASEEHKQVMAQIQKEERKDEQQFKKDMEDLEIRAGELEKKDKSIHRILDLLEAGEISEDILVDTIRALKQ